MSYDFSKTEAAAASSYLVPGFYRMKVTAVKLETMANEKATKYLGFIFSTDDGTSFTEKFFLSEKAIARLQYLHEAWTNKKCDKVFKTDKEVEAYFAKLFANPKAPSKLLVVGGEESKDKIYAQLPYSGFVVTDEEGVEEGPFEEGDANWKKYVKHSSRTNESTGRGNGRLNETDENDTPDSTPSKTASKKAVKKTDDEEEAENDLPW